MNKEKVLDFSETVNGLYSRDELEILYDLAVSLPAGSRILEIGVLYGRSASIFMQLQSELNFQLYWVDPWLVNGPDAFESFRDLIKRTNAVGNLYCIRSEDAGLEIGGTFDLVHIDGHHEAPGPATDCELWLPRLNSGGIACFHDYHAIAVPYPDVDAAVDKYTAGWEILPGSGRLAVRKKP